MRGLDDRLKALENTKAAIDRRVFINAGPRVQSAEEWMAFYGIDGAEKRWQTMTEGERAALVASWPKDWQERWWGHVAWARETWGVEPGERATLK